MSIEIAPVFGALYITNGQSTLIVRQTPRTMEWIVEDQAEAGLAPSKRTVLARGDHRQKMIDAATELLAA